MDSITGIYGDQLVKQLKLTERMVEAIKEDRFTPAPATIKGLVSRGLASDTPGSYGSLTTDGKHVAMHLLMDADAHVTCETCEPTAEPAVFSDDAVQLISEYGREGANVAKAIMADLYPSPMEASDYDRMNADMEGASIRAEEEAEAAEEVTRERISSWLLGYAWMGTTEEKVANVRCIMSQDGWQHVSVTAERFEGAQSGDDAEVRMTGDDFALSALYECHDAPHLDTCPCVAGYAHRSAPRPPVTVEVDGRVMTLMLNGVPVRLDSTLVDNHDAVFYVWGGSYENGRLQVQGGYAGKPVALFDTGLFPRIEWRDSFDDLLAELFPGDADAVSTYAECAAQLPMERSGCEVCRPDQSCRFHVSVEAWVKASEVFDPWWKVKPSASTEHASESVILAAYDVGVSERARVTTVRPWKTSTKSSKHKRRARR